MPGYNDGDVLKQTLADLYALNPGVRTVAIVPVGLTSHREGLPELRPVGRAEALKAVKTVEDFAEKCRAECGIRFVFASDEMYERAGCPHHDTQAANTCRNWPTASGSSAICSTDSNGR